MQRLPLANREAEIGFFAGMVAAMSDERILLLEAGGGMGKTTLMAEFVRHCRAEDVDCVPVDLKGDPGLHEVLARLCDGLGWESFPTFAVRVKELGRQGGGRAADTARFEHIHREEYNRRAIQALMVEAFAVTELRAFCWGRPRFEGALDQTVLITDKSEQVRTVIDFCQRHHAELDKLLVALRGERFEQYKRYYARIYGVEAEAPASRETARAVRAGLGRGEIRDALRARDEGGRATRRGALTRALFEDLGARAGRLAILFDTCEQAGPEVEEWLEGPFLAHAHRTTNLVVVIAGRRVPQTSLEWEACCQHHRLNELREPELWQAYADEIGAALPSPEFIPVFCQHFDGHPLKMMEALAPYVRSGGGR